MRILHVSTSFPIGFPGGITNYVRTLAAAQIRSGHAVDILDGGQGRQWETDADHGYRVRGSEASRQRAHVASMPDDNAGTDEVLGIIAAASYDVVHFHLTIGLGSSFYERFPALGIPYVVSLHDYFLFCPRITMMDWKGRNCGGPEVRKCERCVGVLDGIDVLYRASRKTGVAIPRLLPSSRITRRNAKIEPFLDGAARLLAVSGRVRELFESRYPGPDYQVLHIGTESASRDRLLARVPGERIRIAAIGTLAPYKGAAILEALAAQVTRRDVAFEFWGRVHDQRWVNRLNAAGVELRGEYAPSDLPRIMSEVDLGLVVPIWEDNAPQVAMEFINFEVPVIATRMGGLPDFVDPASGYLFDPTSEGVQSAVAFIDQVSRRDIELMIDNLPRLTTPTEHEMQIEAIYVDATGSPS